MISICPYCNKLTKDCKCDPISTETAGGPFNVTPSTLRTWMEAPPEPRFDEQTSMYAILTEEYEAKLIDKIASEVIKRIKNLGGLE